MKNKSLLTRIITFFTGLLALGILFVITKPSDEDAVMNAIYNFRWCILGITYLLIFIPHFMALIFPKAQRREHSFAIFMFVSQVILLGVAIILIYLRYRNLLSELVLFIIYAGFAFVYITNIAFIFLSTKHKAKPKIVRQETNELSWITSAQAQLENLVMKMEALGEDYKELSERIIKAEDDVKGMTPFNNATAIKFEHQILDSIVAVISATDKVLAGGTENLESKVSTLENHIRQRLSMTMY